MKSHNNGKKTFLVPEILFYLSVFAAITCFAMVQSYGEPPDEVNRFKVVSFICRHGYLPHGADPEVLLDGYGASYAFQPMLTYIIQGFLLRFLKLFTTDSYVLLVSARMVTVVFGVLMAECAFLYQHGLHGHAGGSRHMPGAAARPKDRI